MIIIKKLTMAKEEIENKEEIDVVEESVKIMYHKMKFNNK